MRALLLELDRILRGTSAAHMPALGQAWHPATADAAATAEVRDAGASDGGARDAARLGPLVRRFLATTAAAGMFYGAVMGTFGGIGGDRPLIILYAALKVPLLLIVTFALALPSFFVLNTLLGLRQDFGAVLRALLGAQAGLTLVLAALAPYTVLWYVSFADYPAAILFNGVLFGVASVAAQRLLAREYAVLAARQPRHRVLQRVWLVIYAFVGVQLGWVLRPFVGAPGMPAEFLRAESWGNAYVVVAKMVWGVVERCARRQSRRQPRPRTGSRSAR